MTSPNRKSLIAVAAIMLQFFIFKLLYPYASFFQDSYTYIDAAATRPALSYRPMGYSWFLMGVHAFSSKDTFLVLLQYLMLQCSGLYLYFTVERLYRPRKLVSDVLFWFLLLNPLNLYVANAVSSDALFTALTICWLTELLKLIQRPAAGPLLRQLLLLVLIFYTRFNALYYPLVAAVACLMAARQWRFRLISIASTVLVVVACVKVMEHITFKETGVKTFSAFSGWQMANNVLYVYPYVKVDSQYLPSRQCKELDGIVKRYFEVNGPLHTGRRPDNFLYLWAADAPLKTYMRRQQAKEKTDYFTAWNRVGPLYSQYGNYIFMRHPLMYGRQFALYSAASFFYPHLEMLWRYNEGVDTVDDVAKNWFHYRSRKVTSVDAFVQGRLLAPFQWLWLLLNLAGIVLIIFFCTTGRQKWKMLDGGLKKALALTLAYCVVNGAFCIFATPSVFRYQLTPMLFLLVFTLPAYDYWLGRWNPAPVAPKE